MFIYLFIYLFLFIFWSLFSLFYAYGKIKICIKKKCLLGLFSLSLLFSNFTIKFQTGHFVSHTYVTLKGVLSHGAKKGGVVAQEIAPPSASQGR